ncbi:uncharacterized protein LODBEIA_P40660 [Lodderomyces beijingensis]|uniref:A-factor-processing enzyme n=1 Tax=Lodderomyces beijingensis TaxID=1775926 RepID=A0ABP0ZU86_9ASCO
MLIWAIRKYFIANFKQPPSSSSINKIAGTYSTISSASNSANSSSFSSQSQFIFNAQAYQDYQNPAEKMSQLSDQYTILADDSQVSKPIIDDRHYRFLKLNSNDLRVLLIHDPQADKSAAALDVNVGSFADKNYSIPGLAHFCEHLLFMGTEKYPKENEYSSFLSKHSGNSNAYTSSEHTNYYFQVGSDYLEGALDRFAQFFISPLFSKSCKDREINAVDSENKKNLQNDNWRLYQLDKSKSNPKHPYNGFSTGNYQTLHVEPESRDVNVRDVLMKFHKDNYSANLMSLVILGKEDLDTLSAWAIEKFSPILNKQLPRPHYGGKLIYEQEQLGKLLKAKPVKELHQLELSFMIPDDLEDKWDCKPQGYFSHLLGHESEGSILHHTKAKGWVTELSSGNMKVCQGNSVYMLEFQLTPSGLENWEKVVVTAFEYLELILKDEPKREIWDEIRNISEVNFRFRQKIDASSTVSQMSSTLYKFDNFIPAENLLNSSVLRKFDPEAIKEFGRYLNPDNFRISLVSQNLTDLTRRERWYGTEYEFEDMSKELYDSISHPQPNKHLHYPEPNPFVPTNFEISKRKVAKPQIAPYLITHDEKTHVWFKQDDQFEVPKGTIEVVFHLPSSNADLVSATKSAVFVEMLTDHLNQITYYASLVGLKVGINTWRDGFAIVVTGYNDKLPLLLGQVLDNFFNFEPDASRFDPSIFKLLKEFKNFGYQVPYYQMSSLHLQLVNEKVYEHEDRIRVLEELKFDHIKEFVSRSIWDAGVFAEVLIHGNFDIKDANEIKEVINNHIASIRPIDDGSSLDHEDKLHLQNFVLQPGEVVRYEKTLKDQDNLNSCIEYYLQFSPHNDDARLRVLIDLLAVTIREPCFDQLRTKEQLGYVVFSGLKKGRTSLGFRILVQSERPSAYLEYRIDEFLLKFGKFVNSELTEEDFAKFKNALKDLKLQRIKHLSEETNRLWNSITDGYYDFDSRSKHVSILQSVTKAEFIKFYNEYLGDRSMQKTGKLIIHLKSQVDAQVSENKRIQSALANYCYKHGATVDHEFIDKLSSDNLAIESVVEQFAHEVERNGGGKPTNYQEFCNQIQSLIEEPIPANYPTGQLVRSVDEFRDARSTGGFPKPVCALSKFYYEHSHL